MTCRACTRCARRNGLLWCPFLDSPAGHSRVPRSSAPPPASAAGRMPPAARGARLECVWWNSQRHRQRRCFVRRRLLRHPGDQQRWTWWDARRVGTRIRKRCQCAVHGIRSHRRRGAGAVKMRAALLPSLLIPLVEAHDAAPARRETFRDPAVVASHDGVLELTLTAARGATQVGGRRVVAQVYNGSYLPPTLRVQPGDVVRLRLVNALDETTDVHVHGLPVSPRDTSANAVLHIAA